MSKEIKQYDFSDNELLSIYKMGWHDYLDLNNKREFYHPLHQRAYEHGWDDAKVGDDVPSVDYQTSEEIILAIRNHK